MPDPYIGEVRMFACGYAPLGWALCNGQVLPISQNSKLFAIISTRYGGNGTNTFALPNLQGCVPLCAGQGQGSQYTVGQSGGAPTVTLLAQQIPSHLHPLQANQTALGTSPNPTGNIYSGGQWQADGNAGNAPLYAAQTPNTWLNAGTVGADGFDQPHQNMMPYLSITFCIALLGVNPAPAS